MDRRPAIVLAESKQAIGIATNNVAEYRGLIAGLEEAAKLHATEVAVSMDSKLVVEQMSGRWKVKHPDLADLQRRARAGFAVRADQLQVDPPCRELARRPVGQRGDGRRGRDRPMHIAGRGQSYPRRRGGPVHGARHPAVVAASRPDRIVGAAALLRPWQSGADRSGPTQADAAARYLGPHGGIAAVISSPLQRCHDTARAAAKRWAWMSPSTTT